MTELLKAYAALRIVCLIGPTPSTFKIPPVNNAMLQLFAWKQVSQMMIIMTFLHCESQNTNVIFST